MEQFKAKNHFVPRLYLKRWANSESQVQVYRLLVSHASVPEWKPAKLGNVAYKAYLYSKIENDSESDSVERWLDSEFETPAERPLGLAISGTQMSRADWLSIVGFLAAQDLRTPKRMMWLLDLVGSGLQEEMERSLQESVSLLERAIELGNDLPEAFEGASPDFPIDVSVRSSTNGDGGVVESEILLGRSMWLGALKHLLGGTHEVLKLHTWTVLRSPPEFQWVTSDNPVLRINLHADGTHDLNGGWGSNGTIIALPISPHHLIYTRIGHQVPARGTMVPLDAARDIQSAIVANAHREIFASSVLPEVTRLRPRSVDCERYEGELSQWRKWRDDQAEAERDFHRRHEGKHKSRPNEDV